MGTGQAFLLLETVATFFMSAVLWIMQLLNYPLMGTEASMAARCQRNRKGRARWSQVGRAPASAPVMSTRGSLRP